MRLAELDPLALRRVLQGDGLLLRTGPFVYRIRSPLTAIAEGLALLYAEHPLAPDETFADFTVDILPGAGLRRWVKPQCRFHFDGRPVFEAMPLTHAFPLLEWSMNWCVSTQAHQFLVLHAATIERGGRAAILPAPPGSGKSTLCAGLTHRGWRLLSDELALIPPRRLDLLGLCRPVSLKNESIAVISDFVPGACFNRVTEETAKGRVTHLKPPADQVARMDEHARPAWVIFPRYRAGAPPVLRPHSPSHAMLELASNAFNYAALGEIGFETLADVVQSSQCFDFEYGSLDDAVRCFDRLAFGQV